MERHRPRPFNRQWFDGVVRQAKALDSRNWRATVKKQLNRRAFISLTGWVYATDKPEFSGNTDWCLAFDHDYASVLTAEELTPNAARWLDFASVIAFPVRSGSEVIGVILALRPLTNGFCNEDLVAISAIARAFSRLLS